MKLTKPVKTQFYIIRHVGEGCEPECQGNPQLILSDEVEDHLKYWMGNEEDPKTGEIKSLGSLIHQMGGKSLELKPLIESEAALSVAERKAVTPKDLASTYKIEYVVLEDSRYKQELLPLDGKIVTGAETIGFIQDFKFVSSLCIGADKSISGFDHRTLCQYLLSPVR